MGYENTSIEYQSSALYSFNEKIGMMSSSDWTKKGATLSDKSARKEFGLTQNQIINAIKDGTLQYRQNHIHGNPYLRLLRNQVESLAKSLYGNEQLERKIFQNKLSQIDSEIKILKRKIKVLEKKKIELLTSKNQVLNSGC